MKSKWIVLLTLLFLSLFLFVSTIFKRTPNSYSTGVEENTSSDSENVEIFDSGVFDRNNIQDAEGGVGLEDEESGCDLGGVRVKSGTVVGNTICIKEPM